MASLLKVAINGLTNPLGRKLFRELWDKKKSDDPTANQFLITCVNDLASIENIIYLLKHDTVYGNWQDHTIEAGDDGNGHTTLVVDGKAVRYCSEATASKLPLGELSVEIVFECSGFYGSKEKSEDFIAAGAKKVIIMPTTSAGNDLPTVVYNINAKTVGTSDNIICVPSARAIADSIIGYALNDIAGYTVHLANFIEVGSYTNLNNLQDTPKGNAGTYQTYRSGAWNLIRLDSSGAKIMGLIVPALNGKCISKEIRTATICGTMSVGTCFVDKFNIDEFNAQFKSELTCPTIYYYESNVPLVSSDVVNTPYVWYCADATSQEVSNGYLVTVSLIYDSTMVQISNAINSVIYFYDNGNWN